VVDDGSTDARTSGDFQFAGAVAGFGMLLRDSPYTYKGDLTYGGVLKVAEAGAEGDASGHRREFIEFVRKARSLSR
jgi:Ca-activated chloride channel homolog